MIYEYSRPTGFFPTDAVTPLAGAAEYEPYTRDLDAIRFPALTAREVVERATFVWNKAMGNGLALATDQLPS